MSLKQIFIYSGPHVNSEPVVEMLEKIRGQNPENSFNIILATRENLLDILADPQTIAGFIPGSDSSQNIRDQIGADGMRGLYDFVEKDGGSLAGLCAGGYLTSQSITYGRCFKDPRHHRQSTDNIGLINANYYGPMAGLVLDYAYKHPENPYISTVNITFQHNGRTIQTPVAYWHGGIARLNTDQRELRPLACFSDDIHTVSGGELDNTIANIAIGLKDFTHSGGKVISSAVHPEVSGAYLGKYAPQMACQHKHYADLKDTYLKTAQTLSAHETHITDLFKIMLAEMQDCGKARRLNKPHKAVASTATID